MRLFRVLALSALCTLFGSVAFAGNIPVNNPSFETLPYGPPLIDQGCGTGCSFDYGGIPGWTVSNTSSMGQFIPGVQDGNDTYFNSVPNGDTVAFINGAANTPGTISQTLSGITVRLTRCRLTSVGATTPHLTALPSCS
jgi:hypothetical protein